MHMQEWFHAMYIYTYISSFKDVYIFDHLFQRHVDDTRKWLDRKFGVEPIPGWKNDSHEEIFEDEAIFRNRQAPIRSMLHVLFLMHGSVVRPRRVCMRSATSGQHGGLTCLGDMFVPSDTICQPHPQPFALQSTLEKVWNHLQLARSGLPNLSPHAACNDTSERSWKNIAPYQNIFLQLNQTQSNIPWASNCIWSLHLLWATLFCNLGCLCFRTSNVKNCQSPSQPQTHLSQFRPALHLDFPRSVSTTPGANVYLILWSCTPEIFASKPTQGSPLWSAWQRACGDCPGTIVENCHKHL